MDRLWSARHSEQIKTVIMLLLLTSAADLGSAPAELIGRFNLIFYSTAEDAVFKALVADR